MKQALLTLCLLLAFGATKAQNDATLEETKYWLNSYGSKLLVKIPNSSLDKEVGFEIKDENLEIIYFRGDKILIDYNIPFKSINKIIGTTGMIEFITEQKYNGRIYFEDEESAARFFKALKHYFSFFDYNIEFINLQDIKNKF